MKKLAYVFIAVFYFSFLCSCGLNRAEKNRIDRQAVVARHFPTLSYPDSLSPFTVGNGEFAFTADVTGLQSFPEFYENSIPLGTQSHWGWHSFQNVNGYELEQTFQSYDAHGRQVAYASVSSSNAGQWLRANPHRLHLGRIGFELLKEDGQKAELSDLTAIDQKLDLWQGVLYSAFDIENQPVKVQTCCHPDEDQVAVQVESGLVKNGRLSVEFKFPYGVGVWGKQTADWNSLDKHTSTIVEQNDNSVLIKRILDGFSYFVLIQWQGEAKIVARGAHTFLLQPSKNEAFSFTCSFVKEKNLPHNSATEALAASRIKWQNFWKSGGAVDISQSTDPRAMELERRIVLSRYLMAVQCAGSIPPQETGLTFNSWYGKFHLEMHWWHGVHFALWGQPELFEKSLNWYNKAMPEARKKAERQGYDGVRWSKMVGPDGRESPSSVGVFLIWQQPHPIYYAELLYRLNPNRQTLQRFQDIVFATADFMASYAQWDETQKRYVLGPPLIPAQEIHRPTVTQNPAFELSYWAFGLRTALTWQERLGLDLNEKWRHVLDNLSELPQADGFYQNAETALNTFSDEAQRCDHPTVLGAFGMLPNESVSVDTMRHTLEEVMRTWNWARTWGWDYPLTAMTAARVGRADLAIEALLMNVQKNTYLNNGHNYQDDRLTIYLPGNGGLLTAVAMMAAGWDGAPDVPAPGFPKDGNWVVKHEGLNPLP